MLTGMGVVFVFLSILVFCTSMLYKLFGEKEPPKMASSKASSDDEIAAASAAVYAYRKKHSKN